MRFQPFVRPNLAADVRQRFRSEKEPRGTSTEVRPGANLADDIVRAYKKALGEDDDADEK